MNEEKRAALAAFLADNSGSINDLEKQFWSQFAGLFDLNGGGLDASSITSGTIDAERLPNTTTTLSSASGVVTVNCAAGYSYFLLSLTENVTSWSFTNLPAAGRYIDLYVQVTQHASSAKTCVSPASAGKTAGWPWVVSPTLSSVEILGLRIFSDGTVHLFPGGVMA